MTASKAFSLSLRRKPWGKKYKCHVLVNMVVKIPKHQVKKATSKNALNLKISCKFSLNDSNLILIQYSLVPNKSIWPNKEYWLENSKVQSLPV